MVKPSRKPTPKTARNTPSPKDKNYFVRACFHTPLLSLTPSPRSHTPSPSPTHTQNDPHSSIKLGITCTREPEPPPPSLPTYCPRPAHSPSFHDLSFYRKHTNVLITSREFQLKRKCDYCFKSKLQHRRVSSSDRSCDRSVFVKRKKKLVQWYTYNIMGCLVSHERII